VTINGDPICNVRPAEDLGELAARINREHDAGEVAARDVLEHFRSAGEALIRAKALCGHGRWLTWLKANVRFSPRTAQAYMRVATHWDKCATAADLRAALRQLTDDLPDEAGSTTADEPPGHAEPQAARGEVGEASGAIGHRPDDDRQEIESEAAGGADSGVSHPARTAAEAAAMIEPPPGAGDAWEPPADGISESGGPAPDARTRSRALARQGLDGLAVVVRVLSTLGRYRAHQAALEAVNRVLISYT